MGPSILGPEQCLWLPLHSVPAIELFCFQLSSESLFTPWFLRLFSNAIHWAVLLIIRSISPPLDIGVCVCVCIWGSGSIFPLQNVSFVRPVTVS